MRIREFLAKRERAALSIACFIVAAVWIWAVWPRQPVLTVTFLNVGQGDAIVVETPSGHAALIDAGPGPSERSGFDAGAKAVIPFLRREGINNLDAFIITHPHEDHIGGALSVVRGVKIESVLDSGIAHASGSYRKLLEAVEERRIPYRRIHRGQTIDFHDGVVMEVLSPPSHAPTPDGDSALNNASVVLLLRYKDAAFLLEGDADKDAEAEMLSSCPDLSAQVLKVAHHGSSRGTTTEWLAAVHPRIAVVSVGRRNPFGHPSSECLERLRSFDTTIYRTDLNGGITVTTDGHRIGVSTTR